MWRRRRDCFAPLSLLQSPRDWTGAELAERLEVSPRTIRNDVERLRTLGYPVHAMRGAVGGYRLGAGAALPPLLLDDEEAVAVALSIRTATSGAIEGLPRSRDGAIRIRDPQRRAVAATVEPYQLANWGRRWYLVAYDLERDDWRTFPGGPDERAAATDGVTVHAEGAAGDGRGVVRVPTSVGGRVAVSRAGDGACPGGCRRATHQPGGGHGVCRRRWDVRAGDGRGHGRVTGGAPGTAGVRLRGHGSARAGGAPT